MNGVYIIHDQLQETAADRKIYDIVMLRQYPPVILVGFVFSEFWCYLYRVKGLNKIKWEKSRNKILKYSSSGKEYA